MIYINKLKKLFCAAAFFTVVFIAAQAAVVAQTIELDYNFHHGTLGWTAVFAGYPPHTDPDGTLYELFAGLRYMPRKLTRVPRRGFYIQGHNRSDGLTMFLKRRLTAKDGIVPNRTYRIEYVITLASNAASGCFGAGGAPGEAVHLLAGATPFEPLAVLRPDGWLGVNFDFGIPFYGGGRDVSTAGNIANGIPCEQAAPYYPFALIQRSHRHTYDVSANPNGELWLLVTTGSNFEGFTKLYYQSIRVKLIPV